MKKLFSIFLLLALCVVVFAACSTENQGLTEAGDYLFGIYKDNAEETPSDYDVVGKVMIGDVAYTVEWTVNVTEGVTIKESEKAGFFTVDVDERAAADIAYTLTATIKDAEGNTIQKTFNRKVPMFKIATFAEYAAAENDATLVVKGIVTGILSKQLNDSANGLYLQDVNNEGGYYVYGLTTDPVDAGIKEGMTVLATGKKDLYNGTYELVEATVEILDSNITPATPVDFTKIYTDAKELTDAALAGKQAMLVTIKGVEITGTNESQGYYHFKLDGLESYVRFSSSNNCVTPDEITAMKAAHAEHFSWTANVTGLISVYNGAFYLIPVSANGFEYLSEIEKTPAEKVDIEINDLDVPAKVIKDSEIALPLVGSRYNDVALSWALTATDCATYDAKTGKLTVTLPDEATTITLTLTATCGTESKTKTFTINVDCKSTDQYVAKPVETPVKDTAYKLAYYNATLGKYLYFNGETAGYYFGTTENAAMAVDVYMEEVTGGVRFYFKKGETKTYLDIYKNGNYVNLRLTETPEGIFTYDATLKTYVANVGGKIYYLGTYDNKTDIRCSETKYITGDNASKVGVTQYIAALSTLAPAQTVAKPVETPVKDTAYKLAYYNATLGKYLYFNGETAGYYFGTTENAAMAVDVYMEEVTGGVRFYFKKGETKTYLDIYKNGNYVNLRLTETPEGIFTYDATLKTYVANVGGKIYYLGTYDNKTDIRCSETKYITGDNASKVGVTQYIAALSTLEIKEVAPVKVETPAKDTAYKLAYYNATLGKYLYFNGETASYYFATTDQLSKAVDVYMEEVTGGVRFYFKKGETKTYLDIYKNGNYVNLRLTETPEGVFTYDATLKTYVANVGGKIYYLGTYDNKTDIRCSETKYISGDNASKVGVTQYVAALSIIEFVK